jgi:hypothetical protein
LNSSHYEEWKDICGWGWLIEWSSVGFGAEADLDSRARKWSVLQSAHPLLDLILLYLTVHFTLNVGPYSPWSSPRIWH